MLTTLKNYNNYPGLLASKNNQFTIGCADPPYGLKQNMARVKSRVRLASSTIQGAFSWDNEIPAYPFWKEFFRITQNQVVFGANYIPEVVGETFKAPRRADFQSFLDTNPIGWIIWDKCNGESDYSDCELIWTSLPFESFVFKFMWAGMRQGASMNKGGVMQGNKKLNEKRIHPTQKPVELYRFVLSFILASRPIPLDKVEIVDPFLGSGSIVIACDDLGINITGYEEDAAMFNKMQKRYSEYKSKLKMKFL